MNLSDQLGSQGDSQLPTTLLSPFTPHIVGSLLTAAERFVPQFYSRDPVIRVCFCRSDAMESNLRSSAYLALSNLIQNSALDCVEVVIGTASVVLDRLDRSIDTQTQLPGSDDRNHHADLQTSLCGVVQVWCFQVICCFLPVFMIFVVFFHLIYNQSQFCDSHCSQTLQSPQLIHFASTSIVTGKFSIQSATIRIESVE